MSHNRVDCGDVLLEVVVLGLQAVSLSRRAEIRHLGGRNGVVDLPILYLDIVKVNDIGDLRRGHSS